MKRFFIWLFSFKSKSKKIMPEIILLVFDAITTIIPFIFNSYIMQLKFIDIFCRVYIIIMWFIIPLFCIMRIVDIIDYRQEKKNLIEKRKYKPIACTIDDIIFWTKNAETPDTIYIEGVKNNTLKLSVDFETVGKNGPFYNKGIFIDGNIVEEENVEKVLIEKCIIVDFCVNVLAFTELNNPTLFQKTIDELKTTLKL